MSRAINVPSNLLRALEQQKQDTGVEALLIHISTDQVASARWQHTVVGHHALRLLATTTCTHRCATLGLLHCAADTPPCAPWALAIA